jgi:hypothetical protein
MGERKTNVPDWPGDIHQLSKRILKAILINMKRAFVFLLGIYISNSALSQNLASFKDEKTGKYGCKDANGKIIVQPLYDTVRSCDDGLTVVGKRVTYSDYEFGLINKTGKLVVPLKYTSIYLAKGFIVMEANLKGFTKSGFMDKNGKIIVPPRYDYVGEISTLMARVGIGDKYGYIDKTGKEIIPLKYDRIFSSDNGLIIAGRNEKYFLVNKTGKETPLNYESIGYEAFGKLLVKQNYKYGFINPKGEEVIPLKYDNAWDFSEWQRTGFLSNVRLGNKSGFIDTSGKEIIPLQYDGVGLFSEGLAKVTMNPVPAADSKNGYIDSAGNLVIPMLYNNAGNFSEGMAAVSKKTGSRNFIYGYIDRSGKEVIPFLFDGAEEFSEGLAAVKLNGKWGFIDKEGNVVISYKYKSVIRGFNNKRANVVLDNDKLITIDKTGKEN